MKRTSIDLSQNLSKWWNKKICPKLCTYKYVYIIGVNILLNKTSKWPYILFGRFLVTKILSQLEITSFPCFLIHIYHIYKSYPTLNSNDVCIETGNNPLTNDWHLLVCKPQYQILWRRYLGSIQPISLVEFHCTSNLLAYIQPTPVSSLHEKPKVHSKFHSQCL